MGQPAGRLGDLQTGHSCFPPSPCSEGSPNVKTNSMPAMRVGDSFVVHCCGPCHTPVLAIGSSTVLINGKGAGRMGDPTKCKSNVMIGSANVLIGG